MGDEIATANAIETDAALARLVREPTRVSSLNLWWALDAGERESAIAAALAAGDAGLPDDIRSEVSRRLHFRPETVADWDDDKVARRAARLKPRSRDMADRLVVALHVHGRRKLMTRFLDSLEIPHENGSIDREADFTAPTADRFRDAADGVLEEFPHRHVITYFLALRSVRSEPLAELAAAWLDTDGVERISEPDSSAASEDRSETNELDDLITEGEVPAPEPAEEETDEFTTLDQHLIRAVVDVAQGVDGALTEDGVVDLVEELLHLNSGRHRSYFHAGFADIVLGRQVRAELPAQNESRLAWYWAGCVNGLARLDDWEAIARLHEEHAAVRKLGKGGTGPAVPTGRLIFDALCRAGRPTQAADAVDIQTVMADPALFGLASARATGLIREDRAAEARPIVELLSRAVQALEAEGFDPRSRAFLEVKRRRAHCLRQLGEVNAARRLLSQLLEEETDPSVRSMILTDLGLTSGGLRSLASIRVPATAEDAATLRDELAEGEERFREAVAGDSPAAGHGHYCLGVLQFLRREYDAAADHLDVAVSLFGSRPKRYTQGGLLATSRLFLAAALCLDLRVSRMRHASDLLEHALEAGGRLPDWILERIVGALELGGSDLASETAGMLVAYVGDSGLDLLGGSEAALRSPEVLGALLERARAPDRSASDRALDYRSVVARLIASGDHDAAGEALDSLEGAAIEGTARDEYLELLADSSNYAPVWDGTDATWSGISVLESAGAYERAIERLSGLFHQTLSKGGFGAAEEARGIIERIREYGVGEERLSALEARLDSYLESRDGDVPTEPAEEARPVRVMFVGGDERQAKVQDDVRAAVAETDPNVSVTFVHPGWSGNWGGTLDTVLGKVNSHDGVVIMRFVRTEFGRKLRASLGDTPWRQCPGAGRRTMAESILLAAEAARQHLDRLDGSIRSGARTASQ